MSTAGWLRRMITPASPVRRPVARHRPLLEALEDRTTPAVHEWTGLGADNLWSNPQNWTNGSPIADASGDIDLVFHTNLTNPAQLVTQNDLVSLVVDSITFDANPGVIGPTTFATGGASAAGYTINGNTITIDTGAAGQNPFGIDITAGVASAAGSTQTFNVGITLLNSNATFRSQQGPARLTINGAIDLGTRTLTVENVFDAAAPSVTISGNISIGNLVKTGTGQLVLSGNNSYTDTTVNGGTLFADSNTALGAATGTVTVNDPGVIRLRTGVTVVKTLLNLNSNAVGGGLGALANTTNTWRGNVTLMAGAGGVALGAGLSNEANTRLIIDGVIGGATSTLFINGAGVVQFTRNNTYTGVTNHNGNNGFGAVQIDAPGGLGAGGSGNESQFNRNGAGPTGSALWLNFNGILQDGGGLAEDIRYAGSGVNSLGAVRSLGNTSVIIPGDITFIAGAPWFFGVDGASGSMTLTGVIDSQGANRALTKVGAGALIVGGSLGNVFQGGVFVNGGTLIVQNNSATPLGLLAGPSGGLVTVNNTGTLRVESGIFLPNPVQLSAGGTLAGSGTVSNNVNSTGGIVSPGASTAILNVVGTVTLDAASTFHVELNAATTPGVGFDQLNVTGTVNLANALLDLDLNFDPNLNDSFTIIVAGTVLNQFAGIPDLGIVTIDGFLFQVDYTPTSVILTAVGEVQQRYAVGSTAGSAALVQVFGASQTLLLNLQPFGGFQGGVRVATGDVNRDGTLDIIVGAGPGAPGGHVKVFNGLTGAEVQSFFAFEGFFGGVFVDARDVNNDSFADILVGAGPGGNGHVRVFDGQTGASLASFFSFAGVTAEVDFTLADLNGDDIGEVVAAAQGEVRVFNLAGAEQQRFTAYAGFGGALQVSAGDVDGDGDDEIITGASINSHVKVFQADQSTLFSFLAYGGFPGAIDVAVADLDGDDRADILTTPLSTAAHVKAFSGLDLTLLESFFAREGNLGVYIG